MLNHCLFYQSRRTLQIPELLGRSHLRGSRRGGSQASWLWTDSTRYGMGQQSKREQGKWLTSRALTVGLTVTNDFRTVLISGMKSVNTPGNHGRWVESESQSRRNESFCPQKAGDDGKTFSKRNSFSLFSLSLIILIFERSSPCRLLPDLAKYSFWIHLISC